MEKWLLGNYMFLSNDQYFYSDLLQNGPNFINSVNTNFNAFKQPLFYTVIMSSCFINFSLKLKYNTCSLTPQLCWFLQKDLIAPVLTLILTNAHSYLFVLYSTLTLQTHRGLMKKGHRNPFRKPQEHKKT